MKIHSPSMSELHAFVTSVRVGSFTRAAQELCVTQGAVSRAVARLEAHFNQALLIRAPNGIYPTPAGIRLLEGTSEALAAIERVSQELRQPHEGNKLSLSVVPTLASVWLIPRLPDFHRRYPDIQLKFVPYRRNEDFSADTPHAAILSGVPGERPGWRTDYIIGREVVVICHPERLQARRTEGRWRSPAELLEEPLIQHANAPDNWRHWFTAAGVHASHVDGTQMDQVSMIVRAVMADMGVAVLQRCLVQEEINSGKVAVPFDLPVSLQHGYLLCCPQRHIERTALTVFREWLLEQAELSMQNTLAQLQPL